MSRRAVGPAADPARRTPRRTARSPGLILAALLAITVAAPASAAPAPPEGLALTGGTLRLIIPSRPAAGYFALSNTSATPRTLTGASSPGCGMLMLHRSVEAGGTERMEMLAQVPVPAHATLRFAPGGNHLMCMDPAPSLTPGATVPITLTFADGATLEAAFTVTGANGR